VFTGACQRETWERPAYSLAGPSVKSQNSEAGLDRALIHFMDEDQADMLLMNSLEGFRGAHKSSLHLTLSKQKTNHIKWKVLESSRLSLSIQQEICLQFTVTSEVLISMLIAARGSVCGTVICECAQMSYLS